MSIPSPNLDDRSFEQLLDEAKALVARSGCGWTDLSPGDPGAVMLDVFAHLTGLLIYRMNRLPEKVYVELLRLIGIKIIPPSASGARLRFSLAKPLNEIVVIPVGTRVTVARWSAGEPPVFATVEPTSIVAGELVSAPVLAYHCVSVNAELVGVGTGLPKQSVKVSQPPIIAPTHDDLDLIVGVEATPEELDARVPALSFEGKTYRIWRRVENFTEGGPDSYAYLADRYSGRITFAPAVHSIGLDGGMSANTSTLARVPAAGREIRLWYRRGGGEDGNLAANTLIVMRDTIRGVQVTNPEPTSGGAAAETVENAMLRGPEEMHSLRRAVTARDFEAVALRASASVARAKAFTKANLWKHAKAGTVEVLLVPSLGTLDQRGGGAVTREALRTQESNGVLATVLSKLDQMRPLCIDCVVKWVRLKAVQVVVRVVVYRGEDTEAVRERVLNRLHLMINPLPTRLQRTGWHFGEPLRASHIYDIVLAEPGVNYVDQVRFLVDEVPDKDVTTLVVDPVQPATWYAASSEILFRSLNDGDGWETVGRFEDQRIESVVASPSKAGLIAVCTRLNNDSSRVHVSSDCGDTWAQVADLAFAINDLAWLERGETTVLLMATDNGLYELTMERDASPLQLMVDPKNPTCGFYAVISFVDGRGGNNVAVAARQLGGIFLSRLDGKTDTFARIHPGDEDIRVLAAQRLGASTFLWAGVTTAGNEQGKGCLRWELPSSPLSVDSPEGWRTVQIKWQGGSCRVLSFDGLKVYAGTHFAGVSTLNSAKPDDGWVTSTIQCGLPMRGSDKLFSPVQALAVSNGGALVMAGGAQGVYRSRDQATLFECASSREFSEKVALPPTWLFCSGSHDIHVVSAHEADGN